MEEKFSFKIQDFVQWYEGQLLYPHHYQQMRYEIQQLALCYLSISTPWYWGIRSLEIDEALLPSGIIRINSVLAVFPDGSVLEKDKITPPFLEIDISSLKGELENKEATIYLAVIKRQPDSANTTGDFPRYISAESNAIVDENTGESPLNIAKLSLRALLVTEEKLSARLSAFPLMKILVQNGAFRKTNFIPPTLSFGTEGPIAEPLKILITKLRQHISYLSVRLQGLKTKDLISVLDYYNTVYNVLTSRILSLEGIYESIDTHPYEMYKELNIAAGTYCALNHNKPPPVFPPYNHSDLNATFSPIMDFINEIIESIKSASISIIFDQDGSVFQQQIKEPYLANKILVIGVRLGKNMSRATGISWIKGAVISCDFAIKDIKEKRILGAERELVEQIPEMGLAAVQDQVFVKVTVDPAFIRADEFLKIFNPSDREDSRPEDLFLYVAG